MAAATSCLAHVMNGCATDAIGVPVLQRMLEGGGSRLHATAHAGALTELQRAGLTRLPAELTAAWVALTDDRKYSRDVGA